MSWNFMTFELLQLTVIESYHFLLVSDSELQLYLPFSRSNFILLRPNQNQRWIPKKERANHTRLSVVPHNSSH